MECCFRSSDIAGCRFTTKCSPMNRISCGDWLGYSPENREFVRFWMSGYYNAAGNSNILDYDRLQRNSAKVAGYCKNHKSDTLPTAIKKSAS
jgi:acid stress chaperone HdeB